MLGQCRTKSVVAHARGDAGLPYSACVNRLAELLRLLPAPDWAALGFLFVAWIGYATFARRRARRRPSFMGSTNRVRRQWMLQSTYREVRVLDAIAVQQMSGAASFFASTTILIIGALVAAIGSTEKASDLVRELPFAARTSVLVFDLKLAVLTGIFVYAFFRFTWSIRQYSAGVLMIASIPEAEAISDESMRQAFADRASRVMALAAESFNDGLRAYYMAFAAVSWFISPWVMAASTAGVAWVLFQREFHSSVLSALEGPTWAAASASSAPPSPPSPTAPTP